MPFNPKRRKVRCLQCYALLCRFHGLKEPYFVARELASLRTRFYCVPDVNSRSIIVPRCLCHWEFVDSAQIRLLIREMA